MAKLSIFFLLCSLSMVLGNYYYYPSASAGAMSYIPSYAGYGYAAPYAVVAAPQPDCDKKEKGGESSSSESSSEESSSSESSEEGEKKSEKNEEKEGGEESKEGGEEKEGSEEKKEGEEKEEGSSSSSEESKEGEKKEKKEEKKKGKEEKYIFPPRTYTFPPVQSVVYAQPTYSYVPSYKTYSIMQSAPISYPKSAYMTAPFAAAPSVKSYASPVTKIISAAPATARIVSLPAAVPAAKTYSAYSTYLSPTSSVIGMPSYLGNNVAYYKA